MASFTARVRSTPTGRGKAPCRREWQKAKKNGREVQVRVAVDPKGRRWERIACGRSKFVGWLHGRNDNYLSQITEIDGCEEGMHGADQVISRATRETKHLRSTVTRARILSDSIPLEHGTQRAVRQIGQKLSFLSTKRLKC